MDYPDKAAQTWAEHQYAQRQLAKRIAHAAIEAANHAPLKVVCAWCDKTLVDGPDTPVSYGICPECYELYIEPQLAQPIEGGEPVRMMTDAEPQYATGGE